MQCERLRLPPPMIRNHYLVDPLCVLCGSADDSVFHRLWQCTAVQDQRLAVISQDIIDDARIENEVLDNPRQGQMSEMMRAIRKGRLKAHCFVHNLVSLAGLV